MKKLLVATILSLSLNGCTQAPPEQKEPQATTPMTGDSTLLDSEDPAIQLADSAQHLD